MNLATQSTALPNLTADLFSDPPILRSLLIISCHHYGRQWGSQPCSHAPDLKKRSGVPVVDVIYVLLLWVWLKSTSIHVFSREALQGFADAHKDIIDSTTANSKPLWWMIQ